MNAQINDDLADIMVQPMTASMTTLGPPKFVKYQQLSPQTSGQKIDSGQNLNYNFVTSKSQRFTSPQINRKLQNEISEAYMISTPQPELTKKFK